MYNTKRPLAVPENNE